MSKLNSLIGVRFGKLVVKERVGSDKNGHPKWFCICDCTKETTVLGTNLSNGYTKSCGCLWMETISGPKKERALETGQASFNCVFSEYKRSAKKRGFCFELSKELFRKLTSSFCFYCGCKPSQERKPRNGQNLYNGLYVFNGIDRQDNSKGYTLENCVPCCRTCNLMKHSKNAEDFLKACKNVCDFQVARLVKHAAI